MLIEVSISSIRQKCENEVRDAKRCVCIKVCLITNSDVYRLEKRGTDIQNEAVPLALVMSGYLPTPQSIPHQINPYQSQIPPN